MRHSQVTRSSLRRTFDLTRNFGLLTVRKLGYFPLMDIWESRCPHGKGFSVLGNDLIAFDGAECVPCAQWARLPLPLRPAANSPTPPLTSANAPRPRISVGAPVNGRELVTTAA